MKTVEMTFEDAAQAKAILLTYAEMQDQNTMQSEAVLGRLRVDEPNERDMIDLLQEQIDDTTRDSENLKRIALLFG